MPLTSNITLPGGVQHLNFNLETPPDLGPEVNCFLQGLAESSGEEDRRMSSPEPPVEELESWVTWRAPMHDMPDWWQELAEVPGVDDHEKLAQEVQASFEFPRWISEWHYAENYHQTPLALLCLCQKSFLLLPDSKPAKTSENCSGRRQWTMPKPSSFGQKKPICLLRANHAF